MAVKRAGSIARFTAMHHVIALSKYDKYGVSIMYVLFLRVMHVAYFIILCFLSLNPDFIPSASGCTGISRWTVLSGLWISQSWSPPFSCSGWPCSSSLQNDEIRSKMFCCFWSNTLEFTPIVSSWSIAVTDSVLCASEDCVILQSIRNTSIAPTWQFRL